MDKETDIRISIEEAADLLEVSTKTIQRHLASGTLTKIKLNHRTYLLKSEVIGLAERKQDRRKSIQNGTLIETSNRDVVTLSRERYERLLIELGELRKEREYLLAAETRCRELELSLKAAEAELAQMRGLLQREQRSRAQIRKEALDQDLKRPETESAKRPGPLKPWWQK